MRTVVVDTNVAVVANARDHPSPNCVVACVRSLRELVKGDQLILDDGWRIIREYRRHLRPSGQPGIGDAFLKWVLTNYRNPNRCRLVTLHAVAGSNTDFAEFPDDARLESFDPADRKFVAVAMAHPSHPPILQALDSEWWTFRGALTECGVTISFLCEEEIQRIHMQKRRKQPEGN